MFQTTEEVLETLIESDEKPVTDIEQLVREVCRRIAPVWPLTNFIAVNPLQGFEDQPFASADALARRYFRARGLPELSYFHRKFHEGRITYEALVAASQEHPKLGSPDQVAQTLKDHALRSLSRDEELARPENRFLTLSEWCDELLETRLALTLNTEVIKWCSAYFDLGEAAWRMPGRDQDFFRAWRELARFDKSFEKSGVAGFREFVAKLPIRPEAAIEYCLTLLQVPKSVWRDYLLRHLGTLPGWSGTFVHFGAEHAHEAGGDPFGPAIHYLAVRLAYDAAGSAHVSRSRFGAEAPWSSLVGLALRRFAEEKPEKKPLETQASAALLWLEAMENVYRDELLAKISLPEAARAPLSQRNAARPSAQAMFCIDVRSERLRRHLEATDGVETFGFAGFFGIPLAYRELAADYALPQCPVLLRPKWEIAETSGDTNGDQRARTSRFGKDSMKAAAVEAKNTSISPFAWVETLGFLGALAMYGRTFFGRFGRKRLDTPARALGVSGIPFEDRVGLATSILRMTGLGVDGAPLARLVVLCGHGSSTTNQAYASALDCGACGGHRGNPNARVAVALFNDPAIRQELAKRDLPIPDDTLFVAAEHDTATDELRLDAGQTIPPSHQEDVETFVAKARRAKAATNFERSRQFDVHPRTEEEAEREVERRSHDWSEARPEWGLAGNAAFVVGRRELTRGSHLEGRVFLHSYRWETDPTASTLEVIMTAPMIVAEWINTQYFFSATDNVAFGSGSKVIHNLVGRMGVMEGNASDLRIGLPLQSVHDGEDRVHEPMRLNVCIEAPKDRITSIVSKHEAVRKLVDGRWIHLIALDPIEGKVFRYVDGGWKVHRPSK